MLINEELERQNMTKYRLSLESGVPHTTIIDICSEVLKSREPLKQAERTSIPEFSRFNIFESEVRNVV